MCLCVYVCTHTHVVWYHGVPVEVRGLPYGVGSYLLLFWCLVSFFSCVVHCALIGCLPLGSLLSLLPSSPQEFQDNRWTSQSRLCTWVLGTILIGRLRRVICWGWLADPFYYLFKIFKHTVLLEFRYKYPNSSCLEKYLCPLIMGPLTPKICGWAVEKENVYLRRFFLSFTMTNEILSCQSGIKHSVSTKSDNCLLIFYSEQILAVTMFIMENSWIPGMQLEGNLGKHYLVKFLSVRAFIC